MSTDNLRFSFSSGPASYDDYVNQAWCREYRWRAILLILISIPVFIFCVYIVMHPSDFDREAWLHPKNRTPMSASRYLLSVFCLPFAWFCLFFFPLFDGYMLMVFSCKAKMWSWHNYRLSKTYCRSPYLYGFIFEKKKKRFDQAVFYQNRFVIGSETRSKSYDYASIYKVIRGNGLFILRVKQSGGQLPRDILLDETTMEGGNPEDFTSFLDSVLGLGVKRLDRKMTRHERRAWRRDPVEKDYWDKVFIGKERQW